MIRLALHWQILIGMLLGATLGLILNWKASRLEVRIEEGLPSGVLSAEISDSSRLSEIEYTTESATIRRVIDPLGQIDGSVRNPSELRELDSVAANLYAKHGRSTANTGALRGADSGLLRNHVGSAPGPQHGLQRSW